MQTPLLRAWARAGVLLLSACLFGLVSQCSSILHANESPMPPKSSTLQPGDYLWLPQLSPAGPTLIVVSLPEQRASVYRNGIRIGVSTVSTGRPDHRTPAGIFTILEKHREHYSNRYDNAPMPFMQRLTWGGVALHGGALPGYPASHGCVRLPYSFAEKLFAITRAGTTVLIVDTPVGEPSFVAPLQLDSIDAAASRSEADSPRGADFSWSREIVTQGPVSVVLSTRDHRVVVLRNGVEIGNAAVQLNVDAPRGTRVYMVLEGIEDSLSPVVPDRPALRWMSVAVPGGQGVDHGPRALVATSGLQVSPQFARRVYDLLTPGATLVVTDEKLESGAHLPAAVLQASTALGAPEPAPADRDGERRETPETTP